jgi:hypothetical protein
MEYSLGASRSTSARSSPAPHLYWRLYLTSIPIRDMAELDFIAIAGEVLEREFIPDRTML